MLTKVKLALEQSQQGVSDDVLNIRVILFSIYSDDENPSSVNIKQYCDVPIMRTCKHGESNTSVLEDPTLQAGNPVKEKAQVHVKFSNSNNHELLHHQRSSKSNKEVVSGEIVSLRSTLLGDCKPDKEEEFTRFQDEYEYVSQKHKMIKKIQVKEMMQD
ncbi:hypothetical protein Tco_1398446 [Tanacetum coccineum]